MHLSLECALIIFIQLFMQVKRDVFLICVTATVFLFKYIYIYILLLNYPIITLKNYNKNLLFNSICFFNNLPMRLI